VQAPIWLQLEHQMWYGFVVDVKNIINPTTKSSKTMITGTYNLSGGLEKTKKLHLINIQAILPGDVDDLLNRNASFCKRPNTKSTTTIQSTDRYNDTRDDN
jgi:hypothetical protein